MVWFCLTSQIKRKSLTYLFNIILFLMFEFSYVWPNLFIYLKSILKLKVKIGKRYLPDYIFYIKSYF